MKKQNKLNAILITLAAIALVTACSSGYQTEEANKIVDQANKSLEEAKSLYVKTDGRNKELFSANVRTRNELRAYKIIGAGTAKEIVSDYEKASDILKEIAKQYDEVSRLNLPEKYKDYAKLKSEEFTKRAEAINVRKGNAQAFMEIDNPDTMLSKFDENNSKSDRLFNDAEEVATKAKKVEDENKEVFKQS
jgi:hypothetical protein